MKIRRHHEDLQKDLQKDLSKLGAWAAKWEMRCNIRTCKVIHIGGKNLKLSLMGSELSVTDLERELGVLVDSSRKVSTQCAAVVKKANFMPGSHD